MISPARLRRRLARTWRRLDLALWETLHPLRPAELLDDVIYDVGLHIGQDTEFYLRKGFRVVAVDANPAVIESVRARFAKAVAHGRLTLVNVGIAQSESASPITFYVNERQSEWSSFIEEVAARQNSPVHQVQVSCLPLSRIIAQYGLPYYVKIDIEEHDAIALQSLLDAGYRPKYLSVENGNQGMLRKLVDAEYTQFKYIQQRDIPQLRLPYPSREGRYVKHAFPLGASGPFGEETPGQWLSADAVRRQIEKVLDPEGRDKNPYHVDAIHGWFDLHARL